MSSRALRARTIAFFEKIRHPQTEMIHRSGMVSFYDNLLYVLSLYQEKTKESGLKANALLKRLFAFKIESGLPSYLHTYPHAPDPSITVRMFAVLVRLLNFQALMDRALAQELRDMVELLSQIDDSSLSFLSRFKLSTALEALGKGKAHLPDIHAFDGSSSAARACLASSLSLIASPHLERLFALYHEELQTFCPPGYFEPFERSYIKKTVLDALVDPSVGGEALLEAPLFSEEMPLAPFKERSFSGEKNQIKWRADFGERFALSWIEKGEKMVSYHAHSFYPLLLFWKGHSCVMTQPRGALSFERTESGISAHMRFSGSFAAESREHRTLMNLHFDEHPGLTFKTGGQSATLFKMGEVISVEADGMSFELSFETDAPLVLRLGIDSRPSETMQESCERGFDRVLALEALEDLQDAEVVFSLVGSNETLSMATPMACMPLST